jgi:hypothetical protein
MERSFAHMYLGSSVVRKGVPMRRTFGLFIGFVGVVMLAGCSVRQPTVNPEVGGFSMIDFSAKRTVASEEQVLKSSSARS